MESVGIPTVCISVAREVAEKVKPPRSVLLKFPFGHPMGEPFDVNQQRTMIHECMKALREIDEPGAIIDPGFRWRREEYGPVDFSDV